MTVGILTGTISLSFFFLILLEATGCLNGGLTVSRKRAEHLTVRRKKA